MNIKQGGLIRILPVMFIPNITRKCSGESLVFSYAN